MSTTPPPITPPPGGGSPITPLPIQPITARQPKALDPWSRVDRVHFDTWALTELKSVATLDIGEPPSHEQMTKWLMWLFENRGTYTP